MTTLEPTLSVVLGVLRETLRGKRAVLYSMSTQPGTREVVEVSDQIKSLAWRIEVLEYAATWLEQLLPQEANFHALRRHQPIAGLPTFRPLRTNDILDGRKLLIEAAGTLDMGKAVNVDIVGDGYTRFAQVARNVVRAVEL